MARAPGFTLLETILALIIGFMVLMGTTGLFFLINTSEKVASERSEQMLQQAFGQQILRRAFMSVVVIDDADMPQADEDAEEDEDQPPQNGPIDAVIDDGTVDDSEVDTEAELTQLRARLVLDWDRSGIMDQMVTSARMDGVDIQSPFGEGLAPQRMEVVVASKPIPKSMVAPTAWAVQRSQAELDLFDQMVVPNAPQEGGTRGVLELRPDGSREKLLMGKGILPESYMNANNPLRTKDPAEGRTGWTLWWREMPPEEFWAIQQGLTWDPDEHPELMQDAVPLMVGLKTARWSVLQSNGEDPPKKEQYFQTAATAYSEIPGYIQLEMQTDDNDYVRWTFEVGWILADEFISDTDSSSDDATTDTDTETEQTRTGTS